MRTHRKRATLRYVQLQQREPSHELSGIWMLVLLVAGVLLMLAFNPFGSLP